ncbi:hypothetical protein NECAME_17795 [Necator americanus]|uniref:Uncharacterized protein n=1 Tax=Necator americanus TaxID=51031 RepID=W2TJU0_NECAM|nr:hypothetical protein NECAME_17795 [Necator americanus]ETN82068.1 hypothetical protein NECAME_17795 [Necator americanus]
MKSPKTVSNMKTTSMERFERYATLAGYGPQNMLPNGAAIDTQRGPGISGKQFKSATCKQHLIPAAVE